MAELPAYETQFTCDVREQEEGYMYSELGSKRHIAGLFSSYQSMTL